MFLKKTRKWQSRLTDLVTSNKEGPAARSSAGSQCPPSQCRLTDLVTSNLEEAQEYAKVQALKSQSRLTDLVTSCQDAPIAALKGEVERSQFHLTDLVTSNRASRRAAHGRPRRDRRNPT